VIFWVVMPCNFASGYQRFGGPCCLHLHGAVTQKTSTCIFTAMKTSNIASSP